MPEIGRPYNPDLEARKNSIKMYRPEGQAQAAQSLSDLKGQNREEFLNQLTGKTSGIQYVDKKEHNKMGKNEFLNLLSAQMQNQNPLNPMDQTKFTSELAQFAQLEQLTHMNESMGAMGENKQLETKYLAASFIGKEIITNGNRIYLNKDGEDKDIYFNLPQDIDRGIVRISDEKGQLEQQIDLSVLSKGAHKLNWNGENLNGQLAGKGTYHITIFGWDEAGQSIPVQTKTSGLVEGVSFENKDTFLTINGHKVNIKDIDKVSSPTAQLKKTNAQILNNPIEGNQTL